MVFFVISQEKMYGTFFLLFGRIALRVQRKKSLAEKVLTDLKTMNINAKEEDSHVV
jgi:hypothetical protein